MLLYSVSWQDNVLICARVHVIYVRRLFISNSKQFTSSVRLLLTDPKLGWCCYFGPPTGYQYRLTGPGKWDGARDAILGTMERILYPLNTRPLAEKVNFPCYNYALYSND